MHIRPYFIFSYKEAICKKLQLRTNDKFPLYCKWSTAKENYNCHIYVEPAEFELEPGEIFICKMMIVPLSYEDISETFMYIKYSY